METSQAPSPEPTKPNATLLAALYQVTARWYANDAQLVWRRLTLFVTLNTALITASVFSSQFHMAIRLVLPVLGIFFSVTWYGLVKRMWTYQDFQSAVLREQEKAMELSDLGGFSRAFAIRSSAKVVEIGGMKFSSSNLTGGIRNRHFTLALFPAFICFHLAFFVAAMLGTKM